MHKNSLEAFCFEKQKLSKREAMIYNTFLEKGALTDRDVMTLLGFTEPNATRPRITSLIHSHWCYEVGDIDCCVTGKRVRLVAARTAQQRQDHIKVMSEAKEQLELPFTLAA
jgi:hypothetical protein